ncbi:MAG: type II/IV secretion system protein [Patescibacteria group bacterium]|nr:type II/IV secretion system protein [Patescibacteria group bacterium]MDE2116360.1 type II/IV secretion system protein [Patescibacteria group bacterium]
MSILDVLVNKKLIQKKDATSISEEARLSGAPIEAILAKKGISEDDILAAKGEYLGVPVRSIKDKSIPFDILKYVPEESALHYRFVPIGVKDNVLEVGVVDPDDIEARDALNFIASKVNMPFKIFLISEEDFKSAITLYKGLSGEVTKALSELETDIADVDKDSAIDDKPPAAGETRIIEDAPVTKIVATILRYAVEGNASDIHIECLSDKVRVRFRVDGDLHTSLVLPVKVHDAVVARIKILSNMKLDEKRKPQDGRFSARIEGRKVDFRVSTFPAYYGEKVVMRILDQERGVKSLEDIGFSEFNLAAIRRAMARPYGLILISGPTGSGKSTTLYAMLNELNDETKNVLSLEDPVEYNMEGVSQSQVRPEIGYTFATGLRTTLRQDPDIIMVGEIRDKETAELAIQAALTGHLVLSTIHTNNAVGVVPRLVDMGIDPYLIAPTLVLAMAQRLVSRICDGGKEIPVEGAIAMMIEKEFSDLPAQFKKEIQPSKTVLEPQPSQACPNGVRGRMAVAEVIETDKDLERAILANSADDALYKLVRSKGMITMKEDAMIKAFKHEIPWNEVNKL